MWNWEKLKEKHRTDIISCDVSSSPTSPGTKCPDTEILRTRRWAVWRETKTGVSHSSPTLFLINSQTELKDQTKQLIIHFKYMLQLSVWLVASHFHISHLKKWAKVNFQIRTHYLWCQMFPDSFVAMKNYFVMTIQLWAVTVMHILSCCATNHVMCNTYIVQFLTRFSNSVITLHYGIYVNYCCVKYFFRAELNLKHFVLLTLIFFKSSIQYIYTYGQKSRPTLENLCFY